MRPDPLDAFVDAIAERLAEKLRARDDELVARIVEALSKKEEPSSKRLTPREAARMVRKSDKTIYKALHSGELKHAIFRGRFLIRPEDLEAWMSAR